MAEPLRSGLPDAGSSAPGASTPGPVASAQTTPRVVIAHDYLTQRGGAERVVLSLAETFPGAPVVTSAYNPDTTFGEFRALQVRTSWLSTVPAFRADPRRAFPVMAPTWSRTRIDDADVVVCSSGGWSHGVATDAPKIIYCHNPARWLYRPGDYLDGHGMLPRLALSALAPTLRGWDVRAAHTATRYVANSTSVAARIRDAYGIDARVIHPPAAIADGPATPIEGIEPGFLLTVSRSRGYKHTANIAAAMRSCPDERLVIVGAMPEGDWPSSVTCVSGISDAQLRWLYREADALLACSYEDFGLTPVEAYSVGTPVLALRAGGYLDTTVEGVTGEFVDSTAPADIADGVRRMRASSYSRRAILDHAQLFSRERFARDMRELVAEVVGQPAPPRTFGPRTVPLSALRGRTKTPSVAPGARR